MTSWQLLGFLFMTFGVFAVVLGIVMVWMDIRAIRKLSMVKEKKPQMRLVFWIKFAVYVGPFASIGIWPPWHQAANVLLDPFIRNAFATFVFFSFIWMAMGMGAMMRSRPKPEVIGEEPK